MADKVLTRHEYERDSQSGAGNCVCGYEEKSTLHPHEFTPALMNPLRCVCRKWANWEGHRPPSTDEGSTP